MKLISINLGLIVMVGIQSSIVLSCGNKRIVDLPIITSNDDRDYLDDIKDTLKYIDSVFDTEDPYTSLKAPEQIDLDISNEIVKDKYNLHEVLGIPQIDISNAPENGTTISWKASKKVYPAVEYWIKIEVSKSSGTLSRDYMVLPEQSNVRDLRDVKKVKEAIKAHLDEADKQSTLFYETIESNIGNATVKDLNNLATVFGCETLDLSTINLYETNITWSAIRGMNISSFKYWYNITLNITKGEAKEEYIFSIRSYADHDLTDVNVVMNDIKAIVDKVDDKTSTKSKTELAQLVGNNTEYFNTETELSEALGIEAINLDNVRLLETSIKWSIERKMAMEGHLFEVTIKVVKGVAQASYKFEMYSSEFFLHTRLKHEINRQVIDVVANTPTIVSRHDKAYFAKLIKNTSISLEVNDIAQVIGIDAMNFSHIKSDPRDNKPYLGAIIQNYSETVTDVYTLSFHAVESHPSNPAVYRSIRMRILPSDIDQDKRDIFEYLHEVQNVITVFDGYSPLTTSEINERYNDPSIIRNENTLDDVFGIEEFDISQIEKNGVTPGTWVKSEYNGPNDHNYSIRVEASKNGLVFGTHIIRKYI